MPWTTHSIVVPDQPRQSEYPFVQCSSGAPQSRQWPLCRSKRGRQRGECRHDDGVCSHSQSYEQRYQCLRRAPGSLDNAGYVTARRRESTPIRRGDQGSANSQLGEGPNAGS